jgi:hypothetical protein
MMGIRALPSEATMDLLENNPIRLRFDAYIKQLASVIGHADRMVPLHNYCTGLLLPGERKSVEPMAALTAPAGTAAMGRYKTLIRPRLRARGFAAPIDRIFHRRGGAKPDVGGRTPGFCPSPAGHRITAWVWSHAPHGPPYHATNRGAGHQPLS